MEDILLYGGLVRPSSRSSPARALLISGGRIQAVGGEAELRRMAGRGAQCVDLRGATVTAGFTDSHIHFTSWALARRRVNLTGSKSVSEVVSRVLAEGVAEGGWIRGHGWNAQSLRELPTRQALDTIPEPVWLDSQDLHSAWLNTRALRLCGITAESPDAIDTLILRDDKTREPSGLVFEAARLAALERLPEPTIEEVGVALVAAQKEVHSLGITGLHSVEVAGLRDFRFLQDHGDLRLRVLQHVQLDRLDEARRAGLHSGRGDDWLRTGCVKMFLDGSLGSRTAWLRQPYSGSPHDYGMNTLPPEAFRAAVSDCAAAGFATAVHAIGDAAVELALEVLGGVQPPHLQHRIEHVQLCPGDLRVKAGRSGIIGSVQPVQLMTDIPAIEREWGADRAEAAFPLGALQRAGMLLVFGSDAPVETPDPRPGLFAATARSDWQDFSRGAERLSTWHPEHSLAPRDAVAAYTENPASAAGETGSRGRLSPGYDADLVAWTVDPMTADPTDYAAMECILTVVGGEIVHDALGK